MEDAFEQKVAQLAGSEAATAPSNDSSATKIDKEVAIESTSGGQGNNVDTGTLALSKPRRYRNKDHLRYVASRPASSVAASLPIRTTFATRSHGRLAARPAMNLRCRSAGCITVPSTVSATSATGGRRLGSSRSALPEHSVLRPC